jgi:hypothetical protein
MYGATWWALVLVGVVLVGFYAVVQVKRWVTKPDEPAGAGFTLSDLRAMHRSGKMTTEEFEKAKLAIVQAAQQAAETKGTVENADKKKPPNTYLPPSS